MYTKRVILSVTKGDSFKLNGKKWRKLPLDYPSPQSVSQNMAAQS